MIKNVSLGKFVLLCQYPIQDVINCFINFIRFKLLWKEPIFQNRVVLLVWSFYLLLDVQFSKSTIIGKASSTKRHWRKRRHLVAKPNDWARI